MRHVSIPTQCEPRRAFLSYRNNVFYMIKKLSPCNRTRVNHYRFIPPLTHTNIRVPFNGGKPASLTFYLSFISIENFRQQLRSDFLLFLLASGFHRPRLAVSFNNKILSPSPFLSCFIINRESGKCQGGIWELLTHRLVLRTLEAWECLSTFKNQLIFLKNSNRKKKHLKRC